MKILAQRLKEIGLAEKEAIVYLACLELGNGSAFSISKHSKLPKSTVYDVLDSLSKKGLVHIYPKGNRRHFSISDPEIILEKIRSKENTVLSIMPELKALHYSSNQKPRVRFYDNEEGIAIVQKEILEEAKEVFAIISAEDVKFEIFASFVEKRVKKKIPIKAIFRDSPEASQYKANDRRELRQSKIINTNFDFSSLEYIWENKVAVLTLKNNIAVTIIEDVEIYKIHRAMFESIWNSL